MALYSWFSRHENEQYSKFRSVELSHQSNSNQSNLPDGNAEKVQSKLSKIYRNSELNVFKSIKVLQPK